MTLHHDLLDQALHLATRETKKPKQASLRRAVSAAYYALFHLLVADGAKRLSPAKPAGLSLLIQRAFNHGAMRDVCKSFADGHRAAVRNSQPGQPPPATRKLITLPLDPPLFGVIQALIDLQEARNEADYNLDKQWNRLDVLSRVQTARQAFVDWAAIRNSPTATVFVVALLLQKHWGR
ncbi:hypothetical protein [Rhodopila sp.]|uniref:hypothetical protein n=1 Tax=Rhodopila sp. TaxID=2480087 RepID=UPI003D0E6377